MAPRSVVWRRRLVTVLAVCGAVVAVVTASPLASAVFLAAVVLHVLIASRRVG